MELQAVFEKAMKRLVGVSGGKDSTAMAIALRESEWKQEVENDDKAG